MKRYFILGLLYLFLSSCGPIENRKDGLSVDTTVVHDKLLNRTPNKLIQYRNIVSKLDSFEISSISSAIQRYKDLFVTESKEKCDSAFVIFNEFYEKVDRCVNLLHQKNADKFDSLFIVYDNNKERPKLSKTILDYKNKIERNGFLITMDEGTTFLKKDWDFIEKFFRPFVSQALSLFLEHVNIENKEGFSTDGGIYITFKQFVDRIVWWETFVAKHDNFVLLQMSENIRRDYITFLFKGMDNTPLLDFQSKKLSDFYKDAYKYLVEKYPKSEVAALIKPYYTMFENGENHKAQILLHQYTSKGIVNE